MTEVLSASSRIREEGQQFDAIVVGGGHNGLVASFYLANAGLKVLVLEKRSSVGGMASEIEFMPGYKGAITNSPGSLEPRIVQDMRLADFGLEFAKPDPTVMVPFPDGRAFVGWRDRSRAAGEFAKFSSRDAAGYQAVLDMYQRFADRLGISVFDNPPTLARVMRNLTTPQDHEDASRILFSSTREILDEFIESDEIKAILGLLALMAGHVSPDMPGSSLGLLHRPLSLASVKATVGYDPRKLPLRGSTGLPRGGMGMIGTSMGRATEAKGTVILREAPVSSISVSSTGEVTGVVLEDSREFFAPLVLSNLNPKTTLLSMVEPGHLDDIIVNRLEKLNMSGASFKLVLALDGLPHYTAAPSDQIREYAACQFRIGPSLDYFEAAYQDFRAGRPSQGPKILGLIPSVTDPSLAPPGKHIMSLNVWHAPYHLAEGHWDTEKHLYAKRIIDTLAQYAPNLPSLITDMRAYSPLDFEREFGLLEGNHLHGDMTAAHWFASRPVQGMSDYKTGIHGLYLSGAGTWPGGTVTGVPGYNSAHQVLKDLKSGVLKLPVVRKG